MTNIQNSIRVLIAGDFVPNERVAEAFAHRDYSAVETLKSVFSHVDYSIVNLECPIVHGGEKPIVKNGPHLHADAHVLEALEDIGVDCMTLANNHFRDFGDEGVLNTLSELSAYKIDYVGGGANLKDAAAVLYKQIGSETLAIINCCEHESSIATDKHCGSNPLNPIQQYYAIQEAKSKADYVLVIVHGGVEHYQLPTPRMQETYRFFIDAGADAVVNHHQHCYSGYEVYNGKPIFYGLGNLCFDNPNKKGLWNEGYMVDLSFEKKGSSYALIPYHQCDVEPKVVLYDEDEKKAFEKRIEELNAIIANPNELVVKYEELKCNTRMKYRASIEPCKSRIMRFLFRKHLFPSIMRRKYVIISNMIECESHRERLLDAIKID